MTQTATPSPAAPASPPRKSRRWWYIGGAALLVVLLLGFGIWYFVFRDDSPEAVDITRAGETAQESGQASGSRSGQGSSALDGTWRIDPAVGSFSDFSGTFVGYRVQEELASIGAKTAVGRTPDVEGSLEIEGTTIPSAEFTANLTTLVSNSDRRDGALRDQAIQTSQFPTATFTLTEPIELDQVPADGATIDVDAVGTLTLHGVTKDVTMPLEAQRSGDVIAVTGQLDIAFADYDIDQPTSLAVLSIEDHGILEVQLFFSKT
jgi:polyisoprenoid-binding protein YceI